MTTTCTVAVIFSTAKRLMDLPGPCQQLHGYEHRVEVTLATREASPNMVVDFYHATAQLEQWIREHWDHTVILNTRDKNLGDAIHAVTKQTIFYTEADPTAEHLAQYMMQHVCPTLFPDARCVRVRLYDTANAWVEVSA